MKHQRGFSLIEITIAVTLVAVVVTSILAILPDGLTAARDAEIRTMTGMILEDVRDRIEGQNLVPGVPQNSPLFYDENGRIVEHDAPGERWLQRFYRVDLKIVEPASQQLPPDTEDLLAALVEIGWPVDAESRDGDLLGRRPSKLKQTFLVTTLTGPDWEEIDPNYEPKIEF